MVGQLKTRTDRKRRKQCKTVAGCQGKTQEAVSKSSSIRSFYVWEISHRTPGRLCGRFKNIAIPLCGKASSKDAKWRGLKKHKEMIFVWGENVEYPALGGPFIFYSCSHFIKMCKKASPWLEGSMAHACVV